jgi:putative transposase
MTDELANARQTLRAQGEGEPPGEPEGDEDAVEPEDACGSPRASSSQDGSAGASPSQDGSAGTARSLPQRKHPAHGVRIYADRPTIVFVTVCTKDRRAWLATDEHHALLRGIWTEASAWLVGRYVIMPDHIHFFAAPGEADLPLDNWVRYWKGRFTRNHTCCEGKWETDHWDRRLRKLEDYDQKWEYVRDNPVRHGLVEKAEDWPCQGEIYELDWW